MKKNFQDILKAEIGKQESVKTFCQAAPKKEDSLSYELHFHLNRNLEIHFFNKKPSYKFHKNISSTVKAQNTSKPTAQTLKKTEVFGYFIDFEGRAEAKLFFASQNAPISETVSKEAFKRMFRKLALKLHPDTTGGCHESFIQLRKHYKALEKAWRPFKEAA